jgi:hypothetical protein
MDLSFVAIHGSLASLLVSSTLSLEMSNPLGVSYAIKSIDLPIYKFTREWNREQHRRQDHVLLVTEAQLVGCSDRTPCVYVPAYCPADRWCGQVPMSVQATLLVDYSEIRTVGDLNLNIHGEQHRDDNLFCLLRVLLAAEHAVPASSQCALLTALFRLSRRSNRRRAGRHPERQRYRVYSRKESHHGSHHLQDPLSKTLHCRMN